MPETDHDRATPSVMLDPSEPQGPIEAEESDESTSEESDEPEEPFDRMLASLRDWLDEAEARLERVTDAARIPDDIPRFVTRYQP